MRRIVILTLGALVALVTAAPAIAGGFTWTKRGKIPHIIGSADSISCPTTTLCVAAGGGNEIHWTTTAGGKGTAWKRAPVEPRADALGPFEIFDVSCPTATFCVAGDDHSNVLTTTTPKAGAAGWQVAKLPSDTYVGVLALSCASPVLCGILDVSGYALTSVAPAGAWSRTRINATVNADLYDLSCVTGLCAATEANGKVWTTTDPSAQPAVWSERTLAKGGKRITTVACGSARLCVAGGDSSSLRVSTDPAGAAATWRSVKVKGLVSPHLYCKSASLCFALSNTSVYVSTKPTRAGSWVSKRLKSPTVLSAISCPTTRLCVLVDNGGTLWVGRR